MAVLIVLIVSFLLLYLIPASRKRFGLARIGLMAMGVMLMFTAVGHFMYLKGMSLMIPPFIPFPEALIIITGIFELVAGICLIAGRFERLVCWSVILFFIVIFPANIYAAMLHINLQKADYSGPGIEYLWFRIPLQIFFIGWVIYFFRLRNKKRLI